MARTTVRPLAAWLLLAGLGCSGLGGSCGSCVETIPGGFPESERTNNAVTAKLSDAGVTFLETRIKQIADSLMVGGMTLDVPPVTQPVPLQFDTGYSWIGTNGVVDLGTLTAYVCAPGAEGSYPWDESAPTSPPLNACQAKVELGALSISPSQTDPSAPVEVSVNVSVRVNTGRIPVQVYIPPYWWGGDTTIGCYVEFDSDKTSPEDLPVDARLRLTVDPNFQNVLAFEVDNVDVTQIVDISDVNVKSDGSGWVAAGICGGLNIASQVSLITTTIEDLARNAINSQVRDLLDTARCRACVSDADCPETSTCQNQLCYVGDPSGHVCAPVLLGLEGRVGVGGALASFGAPAESMVDVYVAAGGQTNGQPDVKVESNGVVVGVMAGTRPAMRNPDGTVTAPAVAACVPIRTFTAREAPTPVSFDDAAAGPSNTGASLEGYHLGIALSDNFLDKAMFDAFQGGLFCLNADASMSTFLSSSLFNTFLPSMRQLTHGKDVPMLIALRPKESPQVRIGRGSVRKSGRLDVPDDPLLTVSLKDVQIDFYALIEERQTRLFSMSTDITLPLSLKFDHSRNTVQPVLANLQTVVSNINASNSDMLAENPQVVADLLGAVVGLVEPIVATLLTPVSLPTFSGLKVVVRDAMGVEPYSYAPDGYQHLALFADLEFDGAMPLSIRTETRAVLASAILPTAEELRAAKGRPKAFIDVKGEGLRPGDFKGYEYSFRVDGGLWSPWFDEERLEVDSPVLMFPGRHEIEVVARMVGAPQSEDHSPAKVGFIVDYDPPSVALSFDRERKVVATEAHDAVSRDDELSFRYRLAGGEWTSSRGPQQFPIAELGADPSLEVEVTDASGHVATAYFGTPADQLGDPAEVRAHDSRAPSGGCASAGLSSLSLVALAGLLGRRRRNE